MRLAYAQALAATGRDDEALAAFRVALGQDPQTAAARLGEAQMLVRLGRYAEARTRLEEARSILPADPAIALALAKLLAASPDPAARDGEAAVGLARPLHAERPTDRTAEVLALALAENGRCAEATVLLGEAAAAARAAGAAARAAALEAEAARVRSGPPCRPPFAAAP
jgi:tetratricopeptide (TPR) repeat protein